MYYLKSITESILKLSGVNGLQQQTVEDEYFQHALTLTHREGTDVLRIGQVNPQVLKKFDIEQKVFYAEFDWKLVESIGNQTETKYKPLSKFPRVERDLALVLPVELRYDDVKERISKAGKPLLKTLEIFDVYQGEQIGKDRKSYAVRLTFEDVNQTLEDKRIDEIMQRIISTLKKELDIEIRS